MTKSNKKPLVFSPASEKQRLLLMDNTTDVILVGGGAGGGKALLHGEKVLTPDGFVNIEDICVGDKVVTPKNTIEKVTHVWPQGEVDIYDVVTQDGRSVKCCGEHLWSYYIAGRKGKNGYIVANTEQLKDIVDREDAKEKGARKCKPVIPLNKELSLPSKGELTVHPYVLGAILGDGGMTGGTVRMTSLDDFMFDKIESLGYKLGKVLKKQKTDAVARDLIGRRKDFEELGVFGKLSQYKFIPEQYKYASIEDRYQVLQGLFDTDGYVSADGKVDFTSVSPQLIADVRFILHSLGFTATVTKKQGKYRLPDGSIKETLMAYTIYVRGENQGKLFSLPRKLERCKVKPVANRIDSITKVGRGLATCIAVSGEDKLFVTTNFIVTHNSTVCLTKNLDGVTDPDFVAVILRRSQPELKRPGGLIRESNSIYPHFKGKFGLQSLTWKFPSGAQITFGAIGGDHDLGGWQGSQLTRCMIDEVGESWSQHQVLFMLSRMRSKSKIHPQLIMTANPNKQSFLFDWVQYCLDSDGVPVKGTENKIRWFTVEENVAKWADSAEECYEKYGKPKGKIMGLGLSDTEIAAIPPDLLFIPKSFRFIPMGVYDNPYLLPPKNTSYLANLLSQPRVNQLRFLHGSWTAVPEGNSFFRPDNINYIDVLPADDDIKWVRAYDLGFEVPSESKRNPDPSASTLMGRGKSGRYYIAHAEEFHALQRDVIDHIIKNHKEDGEDVNVVIPKDSGAGGTYAHSDMKRLLAEQGIYTYTEVMSGWSSKAQRFLPFCAMVDSKMVYVLRGDWTDLWVSSCTSFTGERGKRDDIVDTTSYAFKHLAKERALPQFTFADMSRSSGLPSL